MVAANNEALRVELDALRQQVHELRQVLSLANEHLEQYRQYSDAMAKELGRGFDPSSPYTPEYLAGLIKTALHLQ